MTAAKFQSFIGRQKSNFLREFMLNIKMYNIKIIFPTIMSSSDSTQHLNLQYNIKNRSRSVPNFETLLIRVSNPNEAKVYLKKNF